MNRRRFLIAALIFWLPLGAMAGSAGPVIPYHDLSIFLDPETRTINASDRILFSGGGSASFRLDPSFTITEVSVDGRAREIRRQNGKVIVDLGEAGLQSVVIRYRGRLAPTPDQSATRAAALGPDRAMAGPRGSFLPGWAAWHPRGPSPVITYRLEIETPAGQKAVAPGKLVAEKEAGGRYRAVFESSSPIDGIDLLAGPYQISERMEGNIRLRTYFHKEIAHLSEGYLESASGYIRRYTENIGAYPYPGFHVISGPLPVGLGLPGMTYMGVRVLRLPFIRFTSLGHEVLHAWWGNAITVAAASENHGSGNWAEGLTTFMADYAFTEDKGLNKAKSMRLGWLRDYAALPKTRDRPLSAFVAKVHDAAQVVGYNKAAFVFYMLRKKLGRDAFADGLRRFWQKHKFRAAGWQDLRRAFEAASNQDLKAFFGQWVDRTGGPRISLGRVSVEKDEKAGHAIDITISQQTPFYDLNLPVEIETISGTERFTVHLTEGKVSKTLFTRARPLALALDPDFDLFRRLDPMTTPPILRDVTLNPETYVVIAAEDAPAIEAARSLAKRIMDRPPRFRGLNQPPPDSPMLVIGLRGQVAEYLERAGIKNENKTDAARGTATVWTGRKNGRAYLIAAADTAHALEALIRPLPHYGRQGYLVFDGGRVIEKGTGLMKDGPLRLRLNKEGGKDEHR